MSRQSGGKTIALLQERFKKLEKAKEKRQERELLQANTPYMHSKLLFCSNEQVMPSAQGDFSRRFRVQKNQSDQHEVTGVMQNTHNLYDSEVDTSLHL